MENNSILSTENNVLNTGNNLLANGKNILLKGENVLNDLLGNVYVSTGLKVFLVLYAALVAPRLPRNISNLLNSTLARIIVATLIVLLATKDASLAIISAIAFILTLEMANKYNLIDTSHSYAGDGETSWLPSSKTSNIQEEQENYSANLPKLPFHDNVEKNDIKIMKHSNISDNLTSESESINTTNEVKFPEDQVLKTWRGNICSESKFLKQSEKPSSQPKGYSGKHFHNIENFEVLDKKNNLPNKDSSNEVPNSDQKSVVSTWKNQYHTQGSHLVKSETQSCEPSLN